MKKKKNFFKSTEEDVVKRVRLFKYYIIVAISVALLGGLWMQHQATAESKKGKKNSRIRSELRKDALNKFIVNPTLFDVYNFNAGKTKKDIPVEISAKINNIDNPNILFSFNAEGRYMDTLNLTFNQLNALCEMDSINILIDEIQYVLYGIKSYSRNNGPNFKTYSIGKKDVTLIKKGEDVTLVDIENIKGKATIESGFPYELKDEKITFEIERDEDKVEFRVVGKSVKSDKWSRRIVVNGWEALVFLE